MTMGSVGPFSETIREQTDKPVAIGRGVAKFREMCGQFGGRWVAKLVGQLSGLEIGISQKYDISKGVTNTQAGQKIYVKKSAAK
jgi:hypothetical protein